MAAKKQALEKYRSIMEQADQIADQAAKEVKARAMELLDAEMKLVVAITEGVPVQDMVRTRHVLDPTHMLA